MEKELFCNFEKKISPSYLLRKVVTLMECDITKYDIARHSELIWSFLQRSQNGFIIYDLFHVSQLLRLLANRIAEESSYRDILRSVLNIVKIPPVMIKTSDVFTYERDLQEYFTSLGLLLVSSATGEESMIIEVLKKLLQDSPKSKEYVSCEQRGKALENSELPKMLSPFLFLVEGEIYSKLLELTNSVSKLSKECCKQFLLQNVLNTVITKLSPKWLERVKNFYTLKIEITDVPIDIEQYEVTSSILWNLLFYIRENEEILEEVEVISRISLWSLRDAFRFFAQNRNAVQRNDVSVLILEFMVYFPKMDFIGSGLAEDLASISLMKNVEFLKRNWANQIELTPCEDDYIFYKLLLIAFPYYIHFEGGMSMLENLEVMSRVLNHLKKSEFLNTWSPGHRCVFNLLSWNVIKKISPTLVDDFIESIGPNVMLNCLKKQEKNDENLIIIWKCLDALNYILKRDTTDAIKKSLIYNKGVEYIFELVESFLNSKICHHAQKCIALSFCLMKKMDAFTGDVENRAVEITIGYMKKFLLPAAEDPVPDNKMIFCIVDFLWEAIRRSESFTQTFLRKGGVFHLLDLLQKLPFFVQLHVLGLLVDLCEDSSCIAYLLTWKNNGTTLIPLLMEIFREEEKRLHVKRGPQGQISDTKYPLMGKDQWIQTYCEDYHFLYSPTLADMFLSCRSRIYAIITLINDRHKETVELVNEEYHINQELSAKDQVTMLVAENYFALKLAEAWKEIVVEFERASFQPNQAEQIILSNFIEKMQVWNTQLRATQSFILKNDKKKQIREETNLYVKLCQARLQDALNALTELKYIANCTERMFRISEKYAQKTKIRSGIRTIHSWLKTCRRPITETYLSKLKVTAVFNQSVLVKNKHKNEGLEAMPPVSPTRSDDLLILEETNYACQEYPPDCLE